MSAKNNVDYGEPVYERLVTPEGGKIIIRHCLHIFPLPSFLMLHIAI